MLDRFYILFKNRSGTTPLWDRWLTEPLRKGAGRTCLNMGQHGGLSLVVHPPFWGGLAKISPSTSEGELNGAGRVHNKVWRGQSIRNAFVQRLLGAPVSCGTQKSRDESRLIATFWRPTIAAWFMRLARLFPLRALSTPCKIDALSPSYCSLLHLLVIYCAGGLRGKVL